MDKKPTLTGAYQFREIHESKLNKQSSIKNYEYMYVHYLWASQVMPVVKNLPGNAGDSRDRGSLPGKEDPLG